MADRDDRGWGGHGRMDRRAGGRRDHDEGELDDAEREPALGWPGRRTLVEGLVSRQRGGRRPEPEARQRQALTALRGQVGIQLPQGLRASLERSARADLSGVRVHTGGASAEAAAALGARAFTVGDDIHFGAGEYAPETLAGQRLLAHEVAHAVQRPTGAGVSRPEDAHEIEAESFADTHVGGDAGAVALTRGGAGGSAGAGGGAVSRAAKGQNPRDLPRVVPLYDDAAGTERAISEDSEEFKRQYIDFNIVDVHYWSTASAPENHNLRFFFVHYASGRSWMFRLDREVPVRGDLGGGMGAVSITGRRAGSYHLRAGLIWPDRITERTAPNLVDIATTVQLNHILREQFLELAQLTRVFAGQLSASIGVLSNLASIQHALTDISKNLQRARPLKPENTVPSPRQGRGAQPPEVAEGGKVDKTSGSPKDFVDIRTRMQLLMTRIRSLQAIRAGRQAADTAAESKQVPEEAATTVPGAVGAKSGRIEEPVPGVYQDLDPDQTPKGWHFEDRKKIMSDGTIVVRTLVTHEDGSSGWVERAYDPATKRLEMRNAFMGDLPSWIESVGTPLKPGRGTPTIAYLTMRQMKRLGIQYGEVSTVKLSTIENVEAIAHLEHLVRKGVPPDQAVLETFDYAKTAIVQAGQRVSSAKVVGNVRRPFQVLLEHFETGPGLGSEDSAKVVARHDQILAKYGIKRTDVVLMDYDVHITVLPFGDGAQPTSESRSGGQP